jgi:hypothetical protein
MPFPPDDPLYGERRPQDKELIYLGEISVKGETGLLKLSPEWLLRMRYNPFYAYMQRRVLEWIHDADAVIE